MDLAGGWMLVHQAGKRAGLNLCEVWSLDQCGPGVNLSMTKQAPQLSIGTEKLCHCRAVKHVIVFLSIDLH